MVAPSEAATSGRRRRYPSDATVRRYVSVAQSCGMTVRRIEVSPTGEIAVSDADERHGDDEFERWESRL